MDRIVLESGLLDPSSADRLQALGLDNGQQLVRIGSTHEARRALASRVDLPLTTVEKLIAYLGFLRLRGVGAKLARLLVEADLRDMRDLARSAVDEVYPRLVAANDRLRLMGRLPARRTVETIVLQAREFPWTLDGDELTTERFEAAIRLRAATWRPIQRQFSIRLFGVIAGFVTITLLVVSILAYRRLLAVPTTPEDPLMQSVLHATRSLLQTALVGVYSAAFWALAVIAGSLAAVQLMMILVETKLVPAMIKTADARRSYLNLLTSVPVETDKQGVRLAYRLLFLLLPIEVVTTLSLDLNFRTLLYVNLPGLLVLAAIFVLPRIRAANSMMREGLISWEHSWLFFRSILFRAVGSVFVAYVVFAWMLPAAFGAHRVVAQAVILPHFREQIREHQPRLEEAIGDSLWSAEVTELEHGVLLLEADGRPLEAVVRPYVLELVVVIVSVLILGVGFIPLVLHQRLRALMYFMIPLASWVLDSLIRELLGAVIGKPGAAGLLFPVWVLLMGHLVDPVAAWLEGKVAMQR